ncbi:MAG: hypothetical protein H6510_09660 [Acidobacteria bacterium]|nr:hypothetical protein [Acidobacteriota bacterium]MCB9398072.1 hypothetical protein [Acidobacteriota bacterium]
MSILAFEKIHACGNDFLFFQQPFPLVHLAALCDRNAGVGADGAMLLVDLASDQVNLRHWDPDGSESFCLNGTRSSLEFLYRSGRIGPVGKVNCSGRVMDYEINEFVSLFFAPAPAREMIFENEVVRLKGLFLDVGNPQWVTYPGQIDAVQFRTLAPHIRKQHPERPQGCNVNWLGLGEPIVIQTFERGVENFTKACGSGILASAMALSQMTNADQFQFQPEGPDWVRVHKINGFYQLFGPTRWVFSGVYPCR